MAIADMIPQLTDVELVNLRNNARRLGESGTPQQKVAAAELEPLIEAQLAERLARKPVKAKVVRKPRVTALAAKSTAA